MRVLEEGKDGSGGEGGIDSTEVNCSMMDDSALFVCRQPTRVSAMMARRGGNRTGLVLPALTAAVIASAVMGGGGIGFPLGPIQKNFSSVFTLPNKRANSPHFRVALVRTSNSASSNNFMKQLINSSSLRMPVTVAGGEAEDADGIGEGEGECETWEEVAGV